MISPYVSCEKCKSIFMMGLPEVEKEHHDFGFIWKCPKCKTKNVWIRPDDDGGKITL